MFPLSTYLLGQNHTPKDLHPCKDLGISWNIFYTGVTVEVKYSKYIAERSAQGKDEFQV